MVCLHAAGCYSCRLENERTIAVDFELCAAAKNERRRPAALQQKQANAPT